MSFLRAAGLLAWAWGLFWAAPRAGLRWVDPTYPFGLLVGGACVVFAWPRLRRGEGAQLSWVASGVFAAADVLPLAALGLGAVDGSAGLGSPRLWGGVAAVAVSGVLGTLLGASRISGRRAAYGAILWVIAAALVVGAFMGPSAGWMGRPQAHPNGTEAPGGGRQAAELLPVRLSLKGPLDEAWIRMEGRPPLHLIGPVRQGESKSAVGWLLGDQGPEFQVPEVLSVRVLPVREGTQTEGSFGPAGVDSRVSIEFLDRRPPGDPSVAPEVFESIQGRGRPLPPTPWEEAPWTPILVVAAGLVATRALRGAAIRTSASASSATGAAVTRTVTLGILALSLGGMVAWTMLTGMWSHRAGPEGGRTTRVVEGQRLADGSVVWRQFDRLPGGMTFDGAAELRSIRLVGDTLPHSTTVNLDPSGIAIGEEGVVVELGLPVDPGLRLLMPGVNTWGPLEAVWERLPGSGSFEWAGPWGLGMPLGSNAPEGANGEASPAEPLPAWASQGVAQGRAILLGRAAPGTFPAVPAPDGAGSRAGVTWIRLVDFR